MKSEDVKFKYGGTSKKVSFSEFVTQISAAFEKYLNFLKNRSKILKSAEEPMVTLHEILIVLRILR